MVAYTLNVEPVQLQWTIFERNGHWVTREPSPIDEQLNAFKFLRFLPVVTPHRENINILQGWQHFRYSVPNELLQGGPDTIERLRCHFSNRLGKVDARCTM